MKHVKKNSVSVCATNVVDLDRCGCSENWSLLKFLDLLYICFLILLSCFSGVVKAKDFPESCILIIFTLNYELMQSNI